MGRFTKLQASGGSAMRFRWVFILLAIVLVSATVLAQVTSGTIFGTVKDQSGAMVAKATVTASNPDKGVERKVATADNGSFVIPNLPPGRYNITVEAQGFKRIQKQDVQLSVTDRLNAGEFELQVGTTEAAVTVTADAAELQLQTSSGDRSDLVTGKQLNEVALNGRMALDYVKLVPGVVSSFDGQRSGTGGIDSFNINGTRANQHEFTIDGASNVDTGNNGGTHVTVNTDAIEEVKILTSNYQAEFGKAAGGQVVFTTKSGTNQFHGNARLFHRNEGMNANSWFNNETNTPIAKYRYNYVGYQVGGPVIIPGTDFNKSRNKLFFFWNQEYYRQLIPSNDRTTFWTPTALERVGDFTQSKDANGRPIIIAGPGVVGNKIVRANLPAAQQAVFDQVSKILNLYPLPNVTGHEADGYNYATTLSYDNPRREDVLRLDWQITDKHRFFGRWINNAETQTSPVLGWPGVAYAVCTGNINFPGGCTQKHPGWNLSVNVVSTITPTILNEMSFGPSVTRSDVAGVNGNISVGKNGISLPLLYPVDSSQSVPDLGFGGVPGLNFGWSYFGATPWFQANTTINFNDNLTYVRNKHTYKMGVFYQRSRKDQISWGNVNGQFSFSRTPTEGGVCPGGVGTCTLGHPYASALLGAFDWMQQSSARPTGYFRYNQLEWYVQDTWKLTNRLTLDYGMRFAWIPPQYDDKNQVAIFDPTAYDAAQAVHMNPDGSVNLAAGGNRLNGMRFTKDGTIPTGGWDSRGLMPEPRVGFAYDLFGNSKTILRGGFGMMHDRTQGNLLFDTVFNNPRMVVTPSVSNNNIANLPTLAAGAAGALNQPLSGVFGAASDGKVPTVYSFSLGIQREIGKGTTLDVAYVGTQSRHLVTARDINAVPYGTAFTAAAQDPAKFGGSVPAVEPNLPPEYVAAGYKFSGAYAYPTSYLAPYKGYGQIPYLEFNGTANYNSLQASLQRRFSQGLTFGAVYTYSKSLTTASADEDYVDPYLLREIGYRAANWDRTHVFVANYVYELPKLAKHFGGPKWLAMITDGYEISGVTQFMTGAPIDTGFWTPGNTLTGGSDWSKTPALYWSIDKNGNLILPKVGAPARATRDVLRKGGMQNWDMSLFKNIKLGASEQRYIQLRVEAFNAFNHPNFENKNTDVTFQQPYYDSNLHAFVPMSISKNSNFGKNTSQYAGTGGPRVIQLGAKIYF